MTKLRGTICIFLFVVIVFSVQYLAITQKNQNDANDVLKQEYIQLQKKDAIDFCAFYRQYQTAFSDYKPIATFEKACEYANAN